MEGLREEEGSASGVDAREGGRGGRGPHVDDRHPSHSCIQAARLPLLLSRSYRRTNQRASKPALPPFTYDTNTTATMFFLVSVPGISSHLVGSHVKTHVLVTSRARKS